MPSMMMPALCFVWRKETEEKRIRFKNRTLFFRRAAVKPQEEFRHDT
jgi:hypothetical protein